MLKRLAYLIVLNDLRKLRMFDGVYDAKHGNRDFMTGIETVMAEIAYNAGDKHGREFMEEFIHNLISSEEKAEMEIDKLTESQTIFYPQVDGITPSVIRTEPKKAHAYCDRCNHISCITCKGDKNDPYCVPSNYEPCIDRSTE